MRPKSSGQSRCLTTPVGRRATPVGCFEEATAPKPWFWSVIISRDPFSFGTTRGGLACAGELAGRAVLLVPLGEGYWELLDIATKVDHTEENSSTWSATAGARNAFESWQIEWVPELETRAFAEKYFPGLNPAVVWRVSP